MSTYIFLSFFFFFHTSKQSNKYSIKRNIINKVHTIYVFILLLEILYSIIINYTSNYILHYKLLKYTICILNYSSCYTLHFAINYAIILDDIIWKKPIAFFLNLLKINEKLHFTTINYTPNYTLQVYIINFSFPSKITTRCKMQYIL